MSKESRTPTVWIYPKAYYTFSQWARMAGSSKGGGYEMCSFGRTIVEDNECVITDAYMTKHEGTTGSFEADDEDLCMLMMKLNAEGIPPDEAFRTWVHSHPGTGESATFLSGTDEAMIDRFMTGEFLISIVFDSAGKNPFCRIDTKNPRMSIVADLELYIPYLTEEEIKENQEIFKEKSSKKSYTPSKYVASKPNGKSKSSSWVSSSSSSSGSSSSGGHTSRYGSGYSGGYGGVYDGSEEYGWPDYTDRRTGSYSSLTYTSEAVQIDLVDTDKKTDIELPASIDGLSMEQLRDQFAKVFELDDEDVQEQWLKWIAESEGFEDLFEIVDVIGEAKEAGHVGKPATAAPDQAAENEDKDGDGDAEVIMIDLPAADDDDDDSKNPVEKLGATAIELIGSALAERVTDAQEAGDDGIPDALVGSVVARFQLLSDLDQLASRVVESDLTKDQAIATAVEQFNLTVADATTAIEERVG